MSKIKCSIASSPEERRKCYDKYAYAQNATANPVEYFQLSEESYYFTKSNAGYCISSTSLDNKSSQGLMGRIWKFSRTINKSSHTILKRKILKIIKIVRFQSSIPRSFELRFKKNELVREVKKLNNRWKCGLRGNCGMTKSILCLILRKSYKSNKQGKKCSFIGSQMCENMNSRRKQNENRRKSCGKLLAVLWYSKGYLLQKRKYITTISPFDESQHTIFNPPCTCENIEAVDFNTSSYLGTDPKYPPSLNNLFKSSKCDLCNVFMNSLHTASRHYISNPHRRRVQNWFRFKYDANGIIKGSLEHSTGADLSDYYCVSCMAKLPSSRHALQHYNSKRHRKVILKRTQLEGIGYFDCKGDWIITGKVINKCTGEVCDQIYVETPFGSERVTLYDASKIDSESEVEVIPHKSSTEGLNEESATMSHSSKELESEATDFERNIQTSNCSSNSEPRSEGINFDYSNDEPVHPKLGEHSVNRTANITDTNTTHQLDSLEDSQIFSVAMTTLCCMACSVKATSQTQMLSHLEGARHLKKIKLLGKTQNPVITIAESLNLDNPKDMSIYRTPSGYYYCDPCRITVSDADRISRHIASKRHALTLRESKGASPF